MTSGDAAPGPATAIAEPGSGARTGAAGCAGAAVPARSPAVSSSRLIQLVRPPRAARRYGQLVAGSLSVGAGIAAVLAARFGADAYGVLVGGVAHAAGAAFGTVNALLGVVLVAAWSVLGRRAPGPGSVLQPIIAGVTVNVLLPLLGQPTSLVARVLLLTAGLLAVGGGAGVYVAAGLGPGPIDGVAVVLAERLRRPLSRVYTVMLGVCLVLGWVLGGPAGVGTAVAAVVVGPLVGVALRWAAVRPARSAADDYAGSGAAGR